MTPAPDSRARAGKVGSTSSKQCFEISGMFDRSGRIFAPAGMMWSVVMSSPSTRRTSAAMSSSRGGKTGSGAMFGPLDISTEPPSSGGGTIIRSSDGSVSGHAGFGYAPSVRGSVMQPRRADAAAVSALAR